MNTPAAFLRLACLGAIAVACFVAALPAQTPPPPAKRLPPAGVAIPESARRELTAGASALRQQIDALAGKLRGQPQLAALLPDVEVLHKAVDWALRYDEFFDAKQVETAKHLLKLGTERATQLAAGKAPWTSATGLVIRGYRSQLDGSVQPYALVVPPDFKPGATPLRRLDVVLAGRNEKRTELAFIAEHEKGPGEIVPEGAIVLHAYGRFCNATKFAGEVDVFEAMDSVRKQYPIDAGRIVVRGFSMGGASTWHLATHFPDVWVAASPGAGFAETAIYTKALAPGKPERTPWEQTLWRWYDATAYAANLRNLPLIAYSGEIDPQKQSADIMEAAMAKEGLVLERLIGPQTAHKYHPETKASLAARLDELVARGRNPRPDEEHFTTYTVRYSHSGSITILEQEQPWERSDVHVAFTAKDRVAVSTRNVAVLKLDLTRLDGRQLSIDDHTLTLPATTRALAFVKEQGRWSVRDDAFLAQRRRTQPRKSPGLSGPIDDAFMSAFLFVRPTGQALNPTVAQWTTAELQHATKLWRDLFRGDVPVKDDTAVTDDDIATKNLILWGDPSSNRLVARLIATKKLPLEWDAREVTLRGAHYSAQHHVPVLVYPNPLNPQHYVALNSGIDFRDEAYGTNALQTPKLPDFAIIDLREPRGPRWPGRIASAGFFDAAWK